MVLTPLFWRMIRSADKIMEEIKGIFEKHKVNLDRVNAVYETAKSRMPPFKKALSRISGCIITRFCTRQGQLYCRAGLKPFRG